MELRSQLQSQMYPGQGTIYDRQSYTTNSNQPLAEMSVYFPTPSVAQQYTQPYNPSTQVPTHLQTSYQLTNQPQPQSQSQGYGLTHPPQLQPLYPPTIELSSASLQYSPTAALQSSLANNANYRAVSNVTVPQACHQSVEMRNLPTANAHSTREAIMRHINQRQRSNLQSTNTRTSPTAQNMFSPTTGNRYLLPAPSSNTHAPQVHNARGLQSNIACVQSPNNLHPPPTDTRYAQPNNYSHISPLNHIDTTVAHTRFNPPVNAMSIAPSNTMQAPPPNARTEPQVNTRTRSIQPPNTLNLQPINIWNAPSSNNISSPQSRRTSKHALPTMQSPLAYTTCKSSQVSTAHHKDRSSAKIKKVSSARLSRVKLLESTVDIAPVNDADAAVSDARKDHTNHSPMAAIRTEELRRAIADLPINAVGESSQNASRIGKETFVEPVQKISSSAADKTPSYNVIPTVVPKTAGATSVSPSREVSLNNHQQIQLSLNNNQQSRVSLNNAQQIQVSPNNDQQITTSPDQLKIVESPSTKRVPSESTQNDQSTPIGTVQPTATEPLQSTSTQAVKSTAIKTVKQTMRFLKRLKATVGSEASCNSVQINVTPTENVKESSTETVRESSTEAANETLKERLKAIIGSGEHISGSLQPTTFNTVPNPDDSSSQSTISSPGGSAMKTLARLGSMKLEPLPAEKDIIDTLREAEQTLASVKGPKRKSINWLNVFDLSDPTGNPRDSNSVATNDANVAEDFGNSHEKNSTTTTNQRQELLATTDSNNSNNEKQKLKESKTEEKGEMKGNYELLFMDELEEIAIKENKNDETSHQGSSADISHDDAEYRRIVEECDELLGSAQPSSSSNQDSINDTTITTIKEQQVSSPSTNESATNTITVTEVTENHQQKQDVESTFDVDALECVHNLDKFCTCYVKDKVPKAFLSDWAIHLNEFKAFVAKNQKIMNPELFGEAYDRFLFSLCVEGWVPGRCKNYFYYEKGVKIGFVAEADYRDHLIKKTDPKAIMKDEVLETPRKKMKLDHRLSPVLKEEMEYKAPSISDIL